MIIELSVVKDLYGSGRGQIWGTIPEFHLGGMRKSTGTRAGSVTACTKLHGEIPEAEE
jgi:hypothetical protein